MKKIEIETIYVGHDNVTYPATATLVIEEDGTFYVDEYIYENDGEWINLYEERDNWTDAEIMEQFSVTIENGRCEDTSL